MIELLNKIGNYLYYSEKKINLNICFNGVINASPQIRLLLALTWHLNGSHLIQLMRLYKWAMGHRIACRFPIKTPLQEYPQPLPVSMQRACIGQQKYSLLLGNANLTTNRHPCSHENLIKLDYYSRDVCILSIQFI